MIMQAIRPSLVLLLLFTLLLGFVYPAVSSGLILGVFHHTADGSLIKDWDGTVKGSMLIGQEFSEPRHFWGRLSATAPAYNAAASSGSNLGVNNPALLAAVQARVDALKTAEPDNKAPIPVDLVTASGSGLDPHISPAAAAYQIGRVARARGLAEETVAKLVADHTEGRQFGILGEPVVNVLALNLDLDSQLDKR